MEAWTDLGGKADKPEPPPADKPEPPPLVSSSRRFHHPRLLRASHEKIHVVKRMLEASDVATQLEDSTTRRARRQTQGMSLSQVSTNSFTTIGLLQLDPHPLDVHFRDDKVEKMFQAYSRRFKRKCVVCVMGGLSALMLGVLILSISLGRSYYVAAGALLQGVAACFIALGRNLSKVPIELAPFIQTALILSSLVVAQRVFLDLNGGVHAFFEINNVLFTIMAEASVAAFGFRHFFTCQALAWFFLFGATLVFATPHHMCADEQWFFPTACSALVKLQLLLALAVGTVVVLGCKWVTELSLRDNYRTIVWVGEETVKINLEMEHLKWFHQFAEQGLGEKTWPQSTQSMGSSCTGENSSDSSVSSEVTACSRDLPSGSFKSRHSGSFRCTGASLNSGVPSAGSNEIDAEPREPLARPNSAMRPGEAGDEVCLLADFCHVTDRPHRAKSQSHRPNHTPPFSRRVSLTSHRKAVVINAEDVDVQGMIGEGWFSKTFRATWNGSTVRCKVIELPTHTEETAQKMLPSLVGTFATEANELANLVHPNLTPLLGVIMHADSLGLLFDYHPIGSLQSLLHRRDLVDLTEGMLLRFMLDLFKGMRFLHKLKQVHGSLQSSNVLVTSDWRCQVADFGLTTVKQTMREIHDGAVNGSGLPWRAPELVKGETLKATFATDVYAAGIIMFELLYREAPYSGCSIKSLPFLVANGHRPAAYATECAVRNVMYLNPAVVGLLTEMKLAWHDQPQHRPTFETLMARVAAMGCSLGGNHKDWAELVRLPRFLGSGDQELAQPPEEARATSPEEVLDGLLLKGKLGAGSYGVVHEGVYHGTRVAVKQLMLSNIAEEVLIDFHRECEMMKAMRHPNIVLFIVSVAASPLFLIVTELVEQGSLRNVIKNSERPTPIWQHTRRAMNVAKDVACGGAFLHRHSPPIIHGDLKSDNILLDNAWQSKICDFGLSVFKGANINGTKAKGTPLWCAPEMLRGEQLSLMADVYSFAILLWEVLCWAEPYEGLPLYAVTFKVAMEGLRPTLPDPGTCDPLLLKIMTTCWQDDPLQRLSFDDIIAMLEDAPSGPEAVVVHTGRPRASVTRLLETPDRSNAWLPNFFNEGRHSTKLAPR